MDAVEFLTNVKRICASNNGCTSRCPLTSFCDNNYYDLGKETIDAAVEAAEKWAKDHPKKLARLNS